MNNKGLVIQTMGVIDADNLEKYGDFHFSVAVTSPAPTNSFVVYTNNVDEVINFSEDVDFVTSSGSVSSTGNQFTRRWCRFAPKTSNNVLISMSKYELESLTLQKSDVSLDSKYLRYSSLKAITITTAATLRADDFSKCKRLETFAVNNNTLEGNVSEMPSSLTTLKLIYAMLDGNIEEYLIKRHNENVMTDLNMRFVGSNVTLNGQAMNGTYTAVFSEKSIVVKNESSVVVATWNGATWSYN